MKTMKKAKAGKSFDLNKDGKTTFKDVLIGRGVLPKTAKKGGSVKKAANGTTTTKTTVKPSLNVQSAMPAFSKTVEDIKSRTRTNSLPPESKRPMNSPEKPMRPNPRPDDISPKERFSTSGVGVNLTAKNGKTMKKAKSGAALKKQAATAIAMKKAGKAPKMKKAMMGASMAKPMMKSGGKMKKCRYGCN